jgi:hypothetical protein
MLGCSPWSLSLSFPHQNSVYAPPLPNTCYIPRHLILLDLITRTILGVEYRSLRFPLCSFSPLPCYLVPLRCKYSPQPKFLPHCGRLSHSISLLSTKVQHTFKIRFSNHSAIYIL